MISSPSVLDALENESIEIFRIRAAELILSKRATRLIDSGRAAPVKYIKTEGYF